MEYYVLAEMSASFMVVRGAIKRDAGVQGLPCEGAAEAGLALPASFHIPPCSCASLLITAGYSVAFTTGFAGVVDADGLAVSAPEAFAPPPPE